MTRLHARPPSGGWTAGRGPTFTQATPVDQAREGLVIAPIRPGHQLWLHHSRRYDWAPVAAFIPLCVTSMPELFRGTADAPPEPVVSRRLRFRQQLNRRQFAVLRRYIAAGSIAAAAYELGISETTARQHLSGLYRRTGCLNAAQAP